MPRSKKDLMQLVEREIRKVLLDNNALRADKLKAIEAGAKIVMVKHRIAESTDGAAGSFFNRELTLGSGPKRVVRRPTADTPASPVTNGATAAAAAGGAAPAGSATANDSAEPAATDPFADW